MLFNSIQFLFFLPIVFLIYWALQKSLKWQNLFIVVASYIFYGWWDWRFLILIALTTLSSYFSGVLIQRTRQRRKQKYICAGNLMFNLLILGIFKYYNFFGENFAFAFSKLGYTLDWVTLDIILPVGISFYTFQSIGYTLDVYWQKIKATKDIVSFFAFVSFFPQLVAGPIERATHLLPQFLKPRHFDYSQAADGMRQILWGFFKKIVIADNCALIVNTVFGNYQNMGSMDLFTGAFLFSFQIYGDFSGYSDIAIGTARLFGIQLMQNFTYPYLADNISDFWRRWHISLTTWFRDYLYIPLGGNRKKKRRVIANTFIVFGASGIWHGANWTYICWGLYHALLFVPLILFRKLRPGHEKDTASSPGRLLLHGLEVGTTFLLVMLGWVLFRSENISQAVGYLTRTISNFELTSPTCGKRMILLVMVFWLVEWIQKEKAHVLQLERFRFFQNSLCRYGLYYALVIAILNCAMQKTTFIYFQF